LKVDYSLLLVEKSTSGSVNEFHNYRNKLCHFAVGVM